MSGRTTVASENSVTPAAPSSNAQADGAPPSSRQQCDTDDDQRHEDRKLDRRHRPHLGPSPSPAVAHHLDRASRSARRRRPRQRHDDCESKSVWPDGFGSWRRQAAAIEPGEQRNRATFYDTSGKRIGSALKTWLAPGTEYQHPVDALRGFRGIQSAGVCRSLIFSQRR
jgi:hypothetical protein